MNLSQHITAYKNSLSETYDADEATAITHLVFRTILNFDSDLLLTKEKNLIIETGKEALLQNYFERLRNAEPVQYVLGEAWFCDLKFKVNSSVLIPRPETEELVNRIIQENKNPQSIIDIGTGSGCIAIALKKNLPDSTIYASDISENALAVAKQNADIMNCPITFISDNVLDHDSKKYPGNVDIIVSNPPYVTDVEKKDFHANVLHYEPHLALFTGSDALAFYRAIAQLALKKLNKAGKLYFEINPATCDNLIAELKQLGFKKLIVKKDISGKNRMLCAH